MGYMRVCRPGSVLGPQQNYLKDNEKAYITRFIHIPVVSEISSGYGRWGNCIERKRYYILQTFCFYFLLYVILLDAFIMYCLVFLLQPLYTNTIASGVPVVRREIIYPFPRKRSLWWNRPHPQAVRTMPLRRMCCLPSCELLPTISLLLAQEQYVTVD